MQQRSFTVADETVLVDYPKAMSSLIDLILPHAKSARPGSASIHFSIREDAQQSYELVENDTLIDQKLSDQQCALVLMNEIVRSIAEHSREFLAIHAAAVCKNNVAVVLPANSGNGKTSLAAWLVNNGFQYLTDELILFHPDSINFDAVYRPFNIKSTGIDVLNSLVDHEFENKQIVTESVVIWPPETMGEKAKNNIAIKPGLFIFPSYQPEIQLQIESLSSAQVGFELMACNVNARNLNDHGFNYVTDLARNVPGIRLSYSSFSQLDHFLPKLIELLVSNTLDNNFLKSMLNASLYRPNLPEEKIKKPVQTPTVLGVKKKLCIAMATYDDYDGVYFSSQAIRLYHQEVTDDTEIMVLDNHPTGCCSEELKLLDGKITNYRYLPVMDKTGTSVRDMIFEHANAPYVLCMDCHVFIDPGAIKKLIEYFELSPQTVDLLQGPMYSDDLKNLSTHFNPVWNKGMYGVWGFDERGRHSDSPAFEIPMQGLGLFACRKDCWPGFNPMFRGFGGEEGYIHEKFRHHGAKTLCLPFLRWMHRFARPQGVPYPINWSDRIRNYLVGFSELGLDTKPIIEHFNEHLDSQTTAQVVRDVEAELNIDLA